MNPIARISPVSDAEAGQLAGPGTLAELGSQIASTSAQAGQRRARTRPGRVRRRLLIGVPVAAALAVAALAVTSLGSPGQKVGPVGIGPAKAEASVMSVTRHGRYLDVLISLNFANAVANLSLNSHMASRIWRKVADVLARSARPNVKMLLLRRYRMTVGSEMR